MVTHTYNPQTQEAGAYKSMILKPAWVTKQYLLEKFHLYKHLELQEQAWASTELWRWKVSVQAIFMECLLCSRPVLDTDDTEEIGGPSWGDLSLIYKLI